MRQKMPRITSVKALDGMRLAVGFEDGWSAEVDLAGFVADFKSLHPLRDLQLFACVTVEGWGSGVRREDGGPLPVAATTVYRLASEQAGDPARSFDAWMMQHGFSASKAVDLVGDDGLGR